MDYCISYVNSKEYECYDEIVFIIPRVDYINGYFAFAPRYIGDVDTKETFPFAEIIVTQDFKEFVEIPRLGQYDDQLLYYDGDIALTKYRFIDYRKRDNFFNDFVENFTEMTDAIIERNKDIEECDNILKKLDGMSFEKQLNGVSEYTTSLEMLDYIAESFIGEYSVPRSYSQNSNKIYLVKDHVQLTATPYEGEWTFTNAFIYGSDYSVDGLRVGDVFKESDKPDYKAFKGVDGSGSYNKNFSSYSIHVSVDSQNRITKLRYDKL